jgi:hypothetical protein
MAIIGIVMVTTEATTGHITMDIVTTIGQDIIQTQGIVVTTGIMIIIDILTKIKVRKTTKEPIQITEVKKVVGVEVAVKQYFMTRISRIKGIIFVKFVT